MSDGVDAAKSLLEGRRPHRCSRKHLRARLEIGAVGAGARQVGRDQPHAFESDAVGERVKAGRAKCLEAVHEGVHAGRGGHRPRQADRQLRIQDHDSRHHLRVEDNFLLVRGLVENYAGPTNFRASAGRGRDRHDRGDAGGIRACPPITNIFEVPQRSCLAGHERDHFAGV